MFILILFIPACVGFSAIPEQHTASYNNMLSLIEANDLQPDSGIVAAIYNASKTYNLDVIEMTAIAIVESRLAASAINYNSNDTKDVGLYQVNTINHASCTGDLMLAVDNALCAAKLLAKLKTKRADYIGAYHSKTPKYKRLYLSRIATVKQKLSLFKKFDTRLVSTSY